MLQDKNSQSDNKLAQTSRDTSAGPNRYHNDPGTIHSSRTDRKFVSHTKSNTDYDLSGVRASSRQHRESVQNQRSTSPITASKKPDEKLQRSGAVTDRPSLRKPSKSKIMASQNLDQPSVKLSASHPQGNPQFFNSAAYKQLSKNLKNSLVGVSNP